MTTLGGILTLLGVLVLVAGIACPPLLFVGGCLFGVGRSLVRDAAEQDAREAAARRPLPPGW